MGTEKQSTVIPVPRLEDKWDLSHMFADTDKWHSTLKDTLKLADELAARKGIAGANAGELWKTAQLYEAVQRNLYLLFVYANTSYDQNMSDANGKDLYETIMNADTAIGEKFAFLAPELMELTPEIFDTYCAEKPELRLYEFFAKDFFAKKEHILTPQMEELLVRMQDIGGSFHKIFDDLTVNDIHFKEIKTPEGETILANEANYQQALIHPNRDFRAEYYTSLLNTYGQHIHTLSSIYYGAVKHNVFRAKSRRYSSARTMSLDGSHVPEAVYDNLVQTVREHTGPLHEYVSLRKKKLGIEDFHFYDFFVPLVPDTDKRYTFEEAKELVISALAVLGDDYVSILKEAIENRWIDVYPTPNKQTGAYSTGAYGSHPYVLLNYTGTLDDVFTLAHELGHALHTYFSNQTQPFIYSDYSLFCAEVASTLNEQLLSDYLLKHTNSPAEKALLLSKKLDDIRSTFYRQTMFADFENQTHHWVEDGRPLLPGDLCALHKEMNQLYYGPDLDADKVLSYEWSRIPHFYSAFYVYQYATGIAASISLAKRILNQNGVGDYRRFLTTGGSDHPIELLKIAGVDMSSPQPILDTIEDFRITMKELTPLL